MSKYIRKREVREHARARPTSTERIGDGDSTQREDPTIDRAERSKVQMVKRGKGAELAVCDCSYDRQRGEARARAQYTMSEAGDQLNVTEGVVWVI
eukprot:1609182-Pleurochrysis_carterae.AAC.1